jgi:tetraacyldisaccharide 4'-kinase
MISIPKAFLWVLSCLYHVMVRLNLFLYQSGILKQHQLEKPVISIGNVTVGGVGKTPLVEYIAQVLKEQNLKPVILTRGYMPLNSKGLRDQGNPEKENRSDEAKMLKGSLREIPVLVGPDRAQNARKFLNTSRADAFLLDDGFQHWRLFRDMDIVAIDATRPWGNGHLIPRGILREPLSSLARAGLFVLTKTDLGRANVEQIKSTIKSINPDKIIVETIHDPVALVNMRSQRIYELSFVKRKRITSFCSIGDPKSFENTLKNLDAKLVKNFTFMDHHVYNKNDIRTIVQFCQKQGIHTIVTTQKDAVKLNGLLRVFDEHLPVMYLKIKISIVNGRDEFVERIHHILLR